MPAVKDDLVLNGEFPTEASQLLVDVLSGMEKPAAKVVCACIRMQEYVASQLFPGDAAAPVVATHPTSAHPVPKDDKDKVQLLKDLESRVQATKAVKGSKAPVNVSGGLGDFPWVSLIDMIAMILKQFLSGQPAPVPVVPVGAK